MFHFTVFTICGQGFEDKKFEVIHSAVENVKKIDKTDVRSKKGGDLSIYCHNVVG